MAEVVYAFIETYPREPDDSGNRLQNRQQPTAPVEKLVELDKKLRIHKQEADKLKCEKNAESRKMADTNKAGKPIDGILKRTKELAEEISAADAKAEKLEAQMSEILLAVANIPDKSVKVGANEADNREVRKWGVPKKTSKDAKPHYEVAEKSLIDFERGAKLTGHRFVVLKGLAARLERSLVNFMLDLQGMNGYTEVLPPFLVNKNNDRQASFQNSQRSFTIAKQTTCGSSTASACHQPVCRRNNGRSIAAHEILCIFLLQAQAGSYQKDIKGILGSTSLTRWNWSNSPRPNSRLMNWKS